MPPKQARKVAPSAIVQLNASAAIAIGLPDLVAETDDNMVFLDQTAIDEWTVTNILSLEAAVLAGPLWELVFTKALALLWGPRMFRATLGPSSCWMRSWSSGSLETKTRARSG